MQRIRPVLYVFWAKAFVFEKTIVLLERVYKRDASRHSTGCETPLHIFAVAQQSLVAVHQHTRRRELDGSR